MIYKHPVNVITWIDEHDSFDCVDISISKLHYFWSELYIIYWSVKRMVEKENLFFFLLQYDYWCVSIHCRHLTNLNVAEWLCFCNLIVWIKVKSWLFYFISVMQNVGNTAFSSHIFNENHLKITIMQPPNFYTVDTLNCFLHYKLLTNLLA